MVAGPDQPSRDGQDVLREIRPPVAIQNGFASVVVAHPTGIHPAESLGLHRDYKM